MSLCLWLNPWQIYSNLRWTITVVYTPLMLIKGVFVKYKAWSESGLLRYTHFQPVAMWLSNCYSYKYYYKLLKYGLSLSATSASLYSIQHSTLQTSLDSFVSHPSLDKHRQEMNVVLQWFTPYWKHLLSKKSIQSSFGFTCLLFSLALADMYLFIWLFCTS